MSRLIESIRLFDGKFSNLFYHEKRMNTSLNKLFVVKKEYLLEELLAKQDVPMKGLYKCRIIYDTDNVMVEFLLYKAKQISSLKIIEADIDYEFKFEDRSSINSLYANRDGCDNIIIVKNNFITDSSFSNLVFRKGNEWFTPNTFLLEGTMRQYFIDTRKIREDEIRLTDIQSFDGVKLINAMVGFESKEIPVSAVIR